mgnify:CR=1 FL=1
MLIAIDHGNKQVKTVHGNAIVSGVQKSKTRPYGRDILKYGGSYYTLSAQRIPYQKDKTTDERFFILSLFAIAEEIEAQGALARRTKRSCATSSARNRSTSPTVTSCTAF